MTTLEEHAWQRQFRTYNQNPFVHSLFCADPSAHVWADGRLYVYPSRDVDPARGCDLMDHYHVFSTDDMVNWRDEGEIMDASKATWSTIDGFMWAPDAAYKNGKYYFYYPHPAEKPWNDTWKIGVAVSDKPGSGFQDLGPIAGVGGHAIIDPAVFVDDDGQAYMYCGGGHHACQAKLNDDMISLNGEALPIDGLEDFHEAAWVFKRNGLYYMTYSDNYRGMNYMRYATSDKPLGPWHYQGKYILPVGCETTHGSVVEYKGQWYAFYHNEALSGQGNLRSICYDPLAFNADGTIQTLVQSINGLPRQNGSEPDLTAPIAVQTADEAVNTVALSVTEEERSAFGAIAHGFNLLGSAIEFAHVNGFKSGKVNLGLYYSSPTDKLAKLRLIVNGHDYLLINCLFTGSTHTFDGFSNITVQMNPGDDNVVQLIGGDGELQLEGISTAPIEN